MAQGLAIYVVTNFMKTIILIAALILTSICTYACCETTGSTVLNVSLVNFNGSFSDDHAVDLTWFTMMEANVDHFEIQRSKDGLNFQDIDSVESKMLITTNDYQLQYKYADFKPLAGKSYYRIKIVGKDGYTVQSPIIMITNNIDDGTKIYPTVVQNNMIYVESVKNLRETTIEFFDLSGKKISETNWENLNGRQNAQVSKNGILPTGTYIARLSSNGQQIKTQLLIVQSH